ncbi:MAG: XRE family transcriptional regulator [Hyphomicrobiales bacterium]|nr:XRE family transcriptional regulator [Hyphomicrobiales bacterium]MCY4033507.1 XRE family transcriptional regulator [Hyphomicrobiales bacterium]MCY4039255.1 XRE family transcriptional regulator [Hyphomicrobiales bacterium]
METEDIEEGSGNVFADLGFPDADIHLLKSGIVIRMDRILRRRRLTKRKAARLLGLSQSKLSRLLRGHFREYSVEDLLQLLTGLGQDVEIVLRASKSRRRGRLSLEVA